MPDIEDGESVEIQGSAKNPYILRNVGGVYSCTCPAWMHQSAAIESRTCKHLRKYRGDEAETQRLGSLPERSPRTRSSSQQSDGPGVLLAQSWDGQTDLTGWWLSEKLDGVRAYWDGEKFVSRQGNIFMAPDWFLEGLPRETHLDGELWMDRKAFQKTVSIVRRQDKSERWRDITFMVFDAPDPEKAFERRLETVEKRIRQQELPYARALDHLVCEGIEHLHQELERIESLGGEGLMMRQPGSRYERCRSHTLLKVKTFHDAEARVVDHLPGTGKHKGRLGALDVEMANGVKFSVGTGFSDKERENPPSIGSIITFRYQELSDAGVPRFPSFIRLREDVDALPDNVEIVKAPLPGKASRESSSRKTIREPINTKLAEGQTRRFGFSNNREITWEITLENKKLTTRFVATGRDDEIKSENFADPTGAIKRAERQIARMLRKGFEEIEPPVATYGESTCRRFEYVKGERQVTWEIQQISDNTVEMRMFDGKSVDCSRKSFDEPEELNLFVDKQVARKLRSGFIERPVV